MLHFPELNKKNPTLQDAEPDQDSAPEVADIRLVDRSSQRWAVMLGSLFSAAVVTCLFALAVLAVFFTTIVADNGEIRMIPILVGMGFTLVIGMLTLEFAHVRSLAGFRDFRRRNALRSKAVIAGVLTVVFAMIHPLMGAAIPLGAGLGAIGQFILARYAKNEPLWDFLPQEAISILSGRDKLGATMASTRPRDHALTKVMTQAGNALAVVIALAIGSYLVAERIMAMTAFVPLILGTLWASQVLLEYTQDRFAVRDAKLLPVASVHAGPAPEEDDDHIGLNVHDLNVRNPAGVSLLTAVNLQAPPGTITAIIGPSGAGKTLLLHAMADPFSLTDMEVSGFVHQSGADLWKRQARQQHVPAVLLPPDPVMLPASGAENLSCFHGPDMLERGKWFLEQLVFATDMVHSICTTPNAQTLPTMQAKSLALARAFVLGPDLYLMDRPEDGLPEKQITALAHRLGQETRMGRSVVMVTDKRALLDLCDRIIVLQDGQVIDYGPATEVRGRMATGWARFLGARKLISEENLCNWVRSHFYRDGDEANRRKVAKIASDMLALSCKTANPLNMDDVSFTFKHFKGHCILRMQDSDAPLSAAKIEMAREEADQDLPGNKLTPLAAILRECIEVDAGMALDDRTLEVKIATYDPRKTPPPTAEAVHADSSH